MLKKQGLKNIFTKFHLSNHYRAPRRSSGGYANRIPLRFACGALFDIGGASKKETTHRKKMLLRPSRSQKHTRNFLPSAGMLRTGFRYVFDVRSAVRCRRSEQKRQDTKGVLSFLEAPPGIEPGIEVLQTFALPLGHSALSISLYKNRARRFVPCLERITGLEPATFALARRRSTK